MGWVAGWVEFGESVGCNPMGWVAGWVEFGESVFTKQISSNRIELSPIYFRFIEFVVI